MDLQLAYSHVDSVTLQTHYQKYTFLLISKSQSRAARLLAKTSTLFES